MKGFITFVNILSIINIINFFTHQLTIFILTLDKIYFISIVVKKKYNVENFNSKIHIKCQSYKCCKLQ